MTILNIAKRAQILCNQQPDLCGIRIWHMRFGKNMNYKIGIFGSAAGEIEANSEKTAKELGIVLSNYKVIIITGACSGLPYLAAVHGSKNGNIVWGYSPMLDLEEQKKFTPKDDLSIYKKLIFTSKNFAFSKDEQACKKYRNVI